MGAFPVSFEKENQRAQRMAALGVREADIEESFVRSGGHGGQNMHKVSTCVMLARRLLLAAAFFSAATADAATNETAAITNAAAATSPAPARGGFGNNAATEKDHQHMMAQLGIKEIRRGRDGNNTSSPNYANYDEAKANPFPVLPDALVLKNGGKVTSPAMWPQRRAEIMEDFDREIYGRIPANTPKVNWEVTSTTLETNGAIPVITKKLAGHVDNSSFTNIAVDIQ